MAFLTYTLFIKQSIRVANEEYMTNYVFYKTFNVVYITLGIAIMQPTEHYRLSDRLKERIRSLEYMSPDDWRKALSVLTDKSREQAESSPRIKWHCKSASPMTW
jgi:hypothetical protein